MTSYKNDRHVRAQSEMRYHLKLVPKIKFDLDFDENWCACSPRGEHRKRSIGFEEIFIFTACTADGVAHILTSEE